MQSIIVSNEILLHRIEISDAEVIYDAVDKNREWLSKWLPFVAYTKEVKDTQHYIASIISKRTETANEAYTIWYKGDFAGIIGFNNTDRVNEKTEIGYWLIQNMCGKGIISNSISALIKYAFEEMMINRICIKCATGNFSSEKVPLRLGFRFEGIERQGERYGQTFFDLKIFSLLKHEFSL